MGKKGSSTAISGPQMSVTIREASTGKKQTNAKSSLKLQHIKNLAMWATHDASIPSLGAFFSHHFAASSEALATPVDPSLFICQRCETILHPGYNCTIRIEKNKQKARHKGKKASHYPQNNIVYTCHFCMHKNMKRGTPRNTNPPKPKPNTILDPLGSTDKGKMGILVKNDSDPAIPTLTLLESKKKRNRSGDKKKVANDQNAEKSVNASTNRKRRKSWTSLKEIAENNDNDNRLKLMNITIPFSME
ncbi:uncharacterized protein LOC111901133 [Lactuca sativa]|uniref:Uncharacterized protein n=1 Tax=Lactuca sativa TaxID=4236 RepID=A0A9R1V7I9_LACSA|nr:uncharacterized protein LOC111901133 [Lactuca sativa]XP_052620720.1 uncharacterized protein LOC111901133 [Lactuca sativa]KAJ0199605.1 hypothetical protein LSAT_V11C600331360 [Lactuca sativa]